MWPPSWSRRTGVSAQQHLGNSRFALGLHFLYSAIWGAGRVPAASSLQCDPYGESIYATQFHSASTWWLLFSSRPSCFLSYQVLFMLKLGKMHLHSGRALPSWWVSTSCFHPTQSKLVVLWNKQARLEWGQTGCVPTQWVASIKESPTVGTLSYPMTLFEMVKKSKANLDKSNKVHASEICWFWSQPILSQKQNWAWCFKDRIHLETVIK